MSNDLDDLFDDGDLAVPTMRGNANLDAQDYTRQQTGSSDTGSDILDDELQEDVPYRQGAGPATDVEGTASLDLEPEQSGPGIEQTTFGQHPWGAGSGGGYRPQSMMRTDMDLSGDEQAKNSKPAQPDAMTQEPEVLMAEDMLAITGEPWSGNRNQQPSNRDLDPDTIYDRESFEHSDSSGQTIGTGIFEMEEGVTWRPRDGSFAHQYALPAYIADEDELGVQQSEMWDTTAGNWRVTQPSASGVPLAARVPQLKRAFSPFVKQPPEMRQEATGPRSHIEAFSRQAAKLIVQEAAAHAPKDRSRFLASAAESLGSGAAKQTAAMTQKLVEYGYPPTAALEDTLAHVVMRATMADLAKGRTAKLNKLAGRVTRSRAAMQQAAAQHLTPLQRDANALKKDVAALMSSPAKLGMGAVGDAASDASAAAAVAKPSLFSVKNVLIGGAVLGGGYLLWANRKKIVKNVKKLVR
jgi:hypothetical protein